MSTVESVVVALCVVSLASLVVQVLGLLRRPAVDLGELRDMPAALQAMASNHERVERALREEVARSREEALGTARSTREELAGLLKATTDASEAKQEKLREVVERHLDELRVEAAGSSKQTRDEVSASLKAFNDSVLIQIRSCSLPLRSLLAARSCGSRTKTLRVVSSSRMRRRRSSAPSGSCATVLLAIGISRPVDLRASSAATATSPRSLSKVSISLVTLATP
jgi:hypothetical protein